METVEMIKRYCDQCGELITKKNSAYCGTTGDRLEASVGKLKVEVLQSWGDTANAGDICKYCILEALNRLDDRPESSK